MSTCSAKTQQSTKFNQRIQLLAFLKTYFICCQNENTKIEEFMGKNTCVLLGKLIQMSKLGMT
jgi:hypothetical protein